jgi:hypothetical protein
MSSFAQTIKKFAVTQNLEAEIVHPFYVQAAFPFNAPPLAIGMIKDEYVEFEISVPPDFVSLNEIPDNFCKFLITRNFPYRIGHWVIEYGENSQEYFCAFRHVTTFSSLNQQRFHQIIRAIEDEFKLYRENVLGG